MISMNKYPILLVRLSINHVSMNFKISPPNTYIKNNQLKKSATPLTHTLINTLK